MKTNPEILLDSMSRQGFSLNVYSIQNLSGGFIIHPVGSLDMNTYKILKNKVDRILETAPQIIIFDMGHVHYINCRGLRVILKSVKQMNRRNRRVFLINLQIQIKEMFEIMNGLLPQWIFADPEELENNLSSMRTRSGEESQSTRLDLN